MDKWIHGKSLRSSDPVTGRYLTLIFWAVDGSSGISIFFIYKYSNPELSNQRLHCNASAIKKNKYLYNTFHDNYMVDRRETLNLQDFNGGKKIEEGKATTIRKQFPFVINFFISNYSIPNLEN